VNVYIIFCRLGKPEPALFTFSSTSITFVKSSPSSSPRVTASIMADHSGKEIVHDEEDRALENMGYQHG